MKRVALRLIGLIILGLVVATLIALWLARASTVDAKLVESFAQQRKDYEKLAGMLAADQAVQAVWLTAVRPSQSIDAPRFEQYRELLKALRLEGGAAKLGDMVLFTRSTAGLLTGGSRKGIAYAVTPPTIVFLSLDSIPANLPPNTLGFRPIEGHWYVFLEYGG